MPDVGEVGPLRTELFHYLQPFRQTEVGVVLLLPQHIQHQHLQTMQLFHFAAGDEAGVGDVGHIGDAVAQHRHFQVQHADGGDGDALHGEGAVPDRMQPELRHPRVFVRCEGVGEFPRYRLAGLRVGVNVHVAVLGKVKGADVVHAGDVVHVLVGQQHKIEVLHLFTQHLLPEVRAGVNDKPFARKIHQHGGAQPFVTRVCGFTDVAVAGDYRYALGGSGAQKGQFHGSWFQNANIRKIRIWPAG